MSDAENPPSPDEVDPRADAAPAAQDPPPGRDDGPPPSREEFLQLAAEVRRLAARLAHGRA